MLWCINIQAGVLNEVGSVLGATGVLLEFLSKNQLIGFQQLDLDYDSASDSVENRCVPALSYHKSQCKTKARNEILLLFSTETPLIVEQFWLGSITKVLITRRIELLCSRVIQ